MAKGMGILDRDDWPEWHVWTMLDRLRGSGNILFSYYLREETADFRYGDDTGPRDWQISIAPAGEKRMLLNDSLHKMLAQWTSTWREDDLAFESIADEFDYIFIPTERSIYLFWLTNQSLETIKKLASGEGRPARFIAPPNAMWRFMELLEARRKVYREWSKEGSPFEKISEFERQQFEYVMNCQRAAILGTAYPVGDEPMWLWNLSELESPKYLPITGAASGQMEAWPFFEVVLASFFLNPKAHFYFEEPETHLHPRAQIEVMKAIAFLVNTGRQFIITTHSPYLLHIINNMILRFKIYGSEHPDGRVSLDPINVSAYRLRDGYSEVIIDWQDTQMIDEAELEEPANELGKEFDDLLDHLDEIS